MSSIIPPPLQGNIRDLIRAPRLAFNAKKVWLLVPVVLTGWLIYTGALYAGYALSGVSIREVWDTFAFFPPLSRGLTSWGWVVVISGLVVALVLLLLGSTGIAKITAEQLRGDDFYPVRETWQFIRENATRIVLSPLLLILFFGMLIFGAWLISFFGRIPGIGPLLLALLTIPAYFYGMFTLLIGAVAGIALIFSPAVTVLTTGDTFDALFDYFWIGVYELGRLLIYLPYALLLGMGAALGLGAVSVLIFTLLGTIAVAVNGIPLLEMIAAARHYLPLEFLGQTVSSGGGFAAFVMGMGFIFTVTICVAYGWTTFIIATLLFFNGVYFRREGQHQLQWQWIDDEPEPVQPATSTAPDAPPPSS
ncbi:MAG: hypothetical protein D6675_02640 [Gemmatimonadetes bacterium]|nr:MAG: hypothetical protein D6675_02640 [Gemmatimonadota bacterium]